jgi:hypothetical protein
MGRPSRFWLGRHCFVVAWLALFFALISPPHGSGISVCWFQGATGIPCLGCGLTRSLGCALRGLWWESWHYHPLGLVLLPWFLLTAMVSILPPSCRQPIEKLLEGKPILWNTLQLLFVGVFVSFGLVRALAVLVARW